MSSAIFPTMILLRPGPEMGFPWDDDADAVDPSQEDAEANAFLTLEVGRGVFALGIGSVHEILDPRPMTPVPGAPHFVLGQLDLRGTSVLAVDGGAVFDLPRDEIAGEARLVVVSVDPAKASLIAVSVDRVRAVEDLDQAGAEIPPGMGSGLCSDEVIGVLRQNGLSILQVDIARALARLNLVPA